MGSGVLIQDTAVGREASRRPAALAGYTADLAARETRSDWAPRRWRSWEDCEELALHSEWHPEGIRKVSEGYPDGTVR
jgi:hypothetical protein